MQIVIEPKIEPSIHGVEQSCQGFLSDVIGIIFLGCFLLHGGAVNASLEDASEPRQ